MDLAPLFPPDSSIVALPNSKNPRLYYDKGAATRKRWQYTQLYPAFRLSARFYRFLIRTQTCLGLSKAWHNSADKWSLGEFVSDILPDVTSAVVLVGTPGPTQKLIVQLWNTVAVVGYVKYAEKPTARARLQNEYQILSALPKGLGPRPLKLASFLDGLAMVIEPVDGKSLSPSLPPLAAAHALLQLMYIPELFSVEHHPWIKVLSETHGDTIEPWLVALTERKWSVVFCHGDFAPWNIIVVSTNQLKAIDWEYGVLEGFPYLDLVHYLLQVASLIYRWSPQKAKAFAISYLSRSLEPTEATAIVELSAFWSYQQDRMDGHRKNTLLQQWRRSIWQRDKI